MLLFPLVLPSSPERLVLWKSVSRSLTFCLGLPALKWGPVSADVIMSARMLNIPPRLFLPRYAYRCAVLYCDIAAMRSLTIPFPANVV